MSSSPTDDGSYEVSSTPGKYSQFLLFGDSLIEFGSTTLQAKLSAYYIRRLDVINRGLSGYNVPWARWALSQFFPSTAPSEDVPHVRLMTIFFGTNDACLPGNAQHTPLPEYRDGLRQIARYPGIQTHQTNLIFISPPPIDEWQLAQPTRTALQAANYAQACCEVATELGFPVLDLWTVFMLKAGWNPKSGRNSGDDLPGSKTTTKNQVLADLLRDGIHFTDAAYQILFEELVKVIEKHYPDGTPERLPMVFPPWRPLMGVT